MKETSLVGEIYRGLRVKYGRPGGQWCLWSKRPKTLAEKEEVAIGAILTQNTNWRNVEKAIDGLKREGLCALAGIYRLALKNKKQLADLIRPAGFFNQKADYLFFLSRFVVGRGGLEELQKKHQKGLRPQLLSLRGVGPETADSILLYALEKPVFVIDEYTRRFAAKNNLASIGDYHFLKDLFESNLRRDYRLYQDFHALIIIDGKHNGAQAH